MNTALSTAAPAHFTGVVLAGGTRAGSIQGGGELINAVMDVLVGVSSLPQNEQALADLAGAWLSQWFAGVTDADDDLVPGSIFTISTAAGPATATVIGTPPAADVAGRRETVALAVLAFLPAKSGPVADRASGGPISLRSDHFTDGPGSLRAYHQSPPYRVTEVVSVVHVRVRRVDDRGCPMARHRWLGAGVVTAGLSINLLSGAAVALAEQDPATDSGGQTAAGEAPGRTQSADPTGGTPSGAESADPQSPDADSGGASESAADPDPGKSDPADTIDQESPAEEVDTDATTDENIAPSLDEHPAVRRSRGS